MTNSLYKERIRKLIELCNNEQYAGLDSGDRAREINRVFREMIAEKQKVDAYGNLINELENISNEPLMKEWIKSMAKLYGRYLTALFAVDPENQALFKKELDELMKCVPDDFRDELVFSLS